MLPNIWRIDPGSRVVPWGSHGLALGAKSAGAVSVINSLDGDTFYELSPYNSVELMEGVTSVTVAAKIWLAPDGSGRRTIISQQIGQNDPARAWVTFTVEDSGKVRIGGRSTGSDSFQEKTGATVLTEAQWHTVFGVLDFTNDTIDLYLDDNAAADTDGSNTVSFGSNDLNAAMIEYAGQDRIGAHIHSAASNTFEGEIFDLALFRRTLSDAERADIHNGARPDQVSGIGPALYWPLDQATDAPGKFANPVAGGIEGVMRGNLKDSTVSRPSVDPLVQRSEARFGQTRALRLSASDAQSVGIGNGVAALEMLGSGVEALQATAGSQPTYQEVGGRSVLRFDGTDDFLAVKLGKMRVVRGLTILALANVSSGFRILSMSNASAAERDMFALSPAAGLILGKSEGTTAGVYSFSNHTDHTADTDELFAARYSGNAVSNWLNGVKRNGTVTNGTELSDGSFLPDHTPQEPPDLELQIGRRLHDTSSAYTAMDLYDLIIVQGAITDEEVQYLEGIMAWDNDLVSLLPASHPWKSTEPGTGSDIDYQWGVSGVVARSPKPDTRFLGDPSILDRSGNLYLAHSFFGDEEDRVRVYRSDDDGATWRGLSELRGFWEPTLWKHTDGSLFVHGTDRNEGNAQIAKSTDGGKTWTSAVLSDGTLLAAAGSGTTAPNYQMNTAQPPLYHDGHVFLGMSNRDPVDVFGGDKFLVLYAPDNTDLLDPANWTATSQLAIGSTGLSDATSPSGATVGMIEPNLVVDGAGEMWAVLRLAGSSTPNKAVFIPLTWSGSALTLPAWDSGYVDDFPGGNLRFQLGEEAASMLALANNNTAEGDAVGSGNDQDQRNHLTLVTGPFADLSARNFTVDRIVIDKADLITFTGMSESDSVDYHGFNYAAFVVADGQMKTAYRISWSGGKNLHDSNFIGFGKVEINP